LGAEAYLRCEAGSNPSALSLAIIPLPSLTLLKPKGQRQALYLPTTALIFIAGAGGLALSEK